ncbi:uncharacterized protein LOC143199587 [Rhynchophorus ferrugineus]|uniref:uncharacterized protein LOC143199587 n=1 Tax=Rhynchophorus ferrugineus TaxID=354439 RepID=UPI003FCCCAB4
MPLEQSRSSEKQNGDINGQILKQASILLAITVDIKECCVTGEKYINYFKTMINGAERALNALSMTTKSSVDLVSKLLEKSINVSALTEDLRQDYDQLQDFLKHHSVIKHEQEEHAWHENSTTERVKYFEARKKLSENILHANTSSTRSFKNDVDEKYPENLSRESLIDLNSVVNLPPVPEDIFTSFSNNKPVRTSSLSSLKSMRKIKLFLQKAESSEDEESSENEEPDYSRLVYGDSDESKSSNCHSPTSKKVHLGYIKEETQD